MKPRKLFLILVGALVVLSSCVAPREVNYLQDIRQEKTIPLNSKFEAVVSPYDELRISVIGFGVEKELDLTLKDPCPTCSGSGATGWRKQPKKS